MAVLKASTRTELGSKRTSRLRTLGKVPGIIYGHGETPVAVSMDKHEVELVIQHHDRLLEVDLDGKGLNVLIKAVQFDPFGAEVLHMDLARVNLDELVEVTVPVVLRGVPAGAAEGGVLNQVLANVTVECQVRAIPDELRVSVVELKLGDKLLAKDIPLPQGATLKVDAEAIVATVTMIAEAEEVAGEEAPAGPEVIGEKKEEEGAEGEEKK